MKNIIKYYFRFGNNNSHCVIITIIDLFEVYIN